MRELSLAATQGTDRRQVTWLCAIGGYELQLLGFTAVNGFKRALVATFQPQQRAGLQLVWNGMGLGQFDVDEHDFCDIAHFAVM